MKVSEVLEKSPCPNPCPDDECNLCDLHALAEKVIPPGCLFCPNCNTRICDEVGGQMIYIIADEQIVGGHNGVDPAEDIHRRAVIACPNKECYQHMAVRLEPIMYNANHDIYYTGADRYLPVRTDDVALQTEIKTVIDPLIADYTQRILGGEKLGVWNLSWWIQGKIQNIVASKVREIVEADRSR